MDNAQPLSNKWAGRFVVRLDFITPEVCAIEYRYYNRNKTGHVGRIGRYVMTAPACSGSSIDGQNAENSCCATSGRARLRAWGTGREPGPEDIYFGPLLRGISAGAAGRDVDLRYAYLTTDEWLGYVASEKIDGLLLLSFSLVDMSVLSRFGDAVLPYVTLGGSPGDDNSKLPFVDASNREAGHAAAEYLMKLGHTRLACVNLAADFTNHADRMQGFQEATAAAGMPIDFDHLLTDFGYNRQMFDSYLDCWLEANITAGSLPTAIFACDYRMAKATLMALTRHGIAVPGDISLIGFDDPPAAQKLDPPMTTISQPVGAMGRRAMERLLEAFADPEHPRMVVGTEVMPTELIARSSTASPRHT